MRVWLLLIGVLWAQQSAAFPEMIRHGYIHCNSCHVSIAGSGLLSEYGRSLSRELLSQYGSEGEEKLAYGLVSPPAWLQVGADVRFLQYFSESKSASRARFLIMQVDVDASAQLGRYRVFGAIGRVEPRVSNPGFKDYISSPRHGVEILLSEKESIQRVAVRMGRFMPTYGIGVAEHTFFIRSLLGFQPGEERNSVELAWNDDSHAVVATAIASRNQNNKKLAESGGVIQASTAIGERSKVGVNYYQSQRDDGAGQYTRKILGAYALVGFTEKVYGLLEIDRPQLSVGATGLVEMFKLGYELRQGLQIFAVHEFANLDTRQSNPKKDAYSIGMEWFPRPHWDLYSLYRQERDTSRGNDFQDQVWLIAHFYL